MAKQIAQAYKTGKQVADAQGELVTSLYALASYAGEYQSQAGKLVNFLKSSGGADNWPGWL